MYSSSDYNFINYRYEGIIEKSNTQTGTWTFENILPLEEIRKFNNLSSLQTNWDDRFKLFRASAIGIVELQANSYILPTNVDFMLCNFSNIKYNNYSTNYLQSNSLILHKNKIRAVNSIQYKDINNQQQTLALDKVRLMEDKNQSILYYNVDREFYPATYTHQYNSIEKTVNINCTVALFTNVNDFNQDMSTNTKALQLKYCLQMYIQSCFNECDDNCNPSNKTIENLKYNVAQLFPIYDLL
jgi:hypothetical protein